MDTFLNTKRPPVFCPGCTHEQIIKGVDNALITDIEQLHFVKKRI